MKKILMILTLAAFTSACNNSSDTKTDTTTTDTLNSESPLMDAKNTADSAVKEIEKVKDTVVKKVNEEIKH